MRPTDEDQSGSRRPNLMSSTRRTASETNILAMLDRHAAGGPGRRLLRGLGRVPPIAWYGTAGVLVIGLVGSLVWLAGDGGKSSLADAAATATARAGAEVLADVDTGRDDPTPPAGATIVDLAPAESGPPALPALPRQEHSGPVLPHGDPRAPQHDPQHDPQPDAPHLAAAPKAARSAGGRPAATARSHAQVRADARKRRAAVPKPDPAAVDTDVALISAIIQHANQRQEAEEKEEVRKP